MPLGVPFKDRHAKRGGAPDTNAITIKQHNRQRIRFIRQEHHFQLLFPEGANPIRITQRNAIRLARWILEKTESNG